MWSFRFGRHRSPTRAWHQARFRPAVEALEDRSVASTYYVATTGSDSGPGTNSQPWLTLQKAANSVHAGDTVIVRAGTYRGFTQTTSGTATARITFQADPGVVINTPNTFTNLDGIYLNQAGYITDGSGANVFIVKDGALATPPFQAGCLDGITKDTVATIARDLGYVVVERNLSRLDLYTAEEAFFTGTAAEVVPIREIDDRATGSGGRGPICKELQEALFAAVHGEDERYRSWLTFVDD